MRGSDWVPGRLPFVWLTWMIGECCLLQGDFDGFNHIAASPENPKYRRQWDSFPVVAKVLRGIDLLLKQDKGESLGALREAVRLAEKGFSAQESPFVHAPHLAHLFYGLALRVAGDEESAAEHIGRAREVLETCHLKAILSAFPEEERRLSEVLREAVKQT